MLSDDLEAFLPTVLPPHKGRQEDMLPHASALDFPTIGHNAGSTLAMLAAARGAQKVFEFGSGFGYSASWFLRGMEPGASIVLTEVDDDIEDAERFLADATDQYELHFERDDALAVIQRYAGPFDIVLLDHDKAAYQQAFDLVVDKMAPGGLIIADNVLNGPVHYTDIMEYVDGAATMPDDPDAAGIVSYLQTVRDHPGAQTTILPVDEGLAVSAIDPERF